MQKRLQLTLFLEGKDAEIIENVRRKYNPAQYDLIKSHITLCREDEIIEIEQVIQNLASLEMPFVCLHLGKPIRFEDGKGVFLPCINENADFYTLRKKVLHQIIENPRVQQPHITLMHPRNSTCTDEIFAEIENSHFPSTIKCTKISLIEQKNGEKWNILAEYPSAILL